MFENINKLFKYKWDSEFFRRLTSRNGESTIPESVSRDIRTGCGLMIAATIISCINSIMMANIGIGIANDMINKVTDINFKFNLSGLAAFGSIGSAIFGTIIICLIRSYFTGNNVRKSLAFCVLLGFSILAMISSVLGVIGAFTSFAFGFFIGLLNLLNIALVFTAMANISVGCIDFCLEANGEK